MSGSPTPTTTHEAPPARRAAGRQGTLHSWTLDPWTLDPGPLNPGPWTLRGRARHLGHHEGLDEAEDLVEGGLRVWDEGFRVEG